MKRLHWITFLAFLLLPSMAAAQAGGSRGYQFVKKGAFDLSFDNALTFKSVTNTVGETDVSTSTFDFLIGVTPKYFLIKNYYVGLNLNFAFATASTSFGNDSSLDQSSSDVGFVGFLETGYYLRLGNSFFLAPKVGAGYYLGTRERPVDGNPDLKAETSLGAIAGKVGLDAVFYAGSQWNLRAGVSFIFRSGNEKPKDDSDSDGIDFTLLDAFYSVGMGYTF